jgi:FMN reductase
MEIKVLAVSGGRHPDWSGRRALDVVLAAATERGAQTRVLDLMHTDLPMFSSHLREQTDAIQEAVEGVNWADVLVLASPDYHGSMSGALKNFLDHFWNEFAGKLFGYVCTSNDKGLTTMDQMRTVVRQCYGWSLPYGAAFVGSEGFDNEGRPTPALESRLRMMGRDLAIYGKVLRSQFEADLTGEDLDTFAARYRPHP